MDQAPPTLQNLLEGPDTFPLLGDLSAVPADYLRDVAHTKRALERWSMDPRFRTQFEQEPQAALDALGVDLKPDQVSSLIFEDEARAWSRGRREGNITAWPRSLERYRAFINEKLSQRATLRSGGAFSEPLLQAWRQRQLRRCQGELGYRRSDSIVHAPMAIELSQGCTVGCWFCGVAAPRFEHNWPYTEDNAVMWRASLAGLQAVLGDGISHGFLYWATDPLDNPDYERFLADFHAVLGRCPQTTTAIGHKDPERSRRLLALAHSLGSSIDRFSVTTLRALERIHDSMTAEELLRVELIPQNKEATDHHRKSNAGRAMRFAEKRAAELVPSTMSSTIACVSGFLINMVSGSVRLITPCNANERWPLGYWVVDERTFRTAEELVDGVRSMIQTCCRVNLGPDDVVRLRPDLASELDGDTLTLRSSGLRLSFQGQTDVERLHAVLSDGTLTVGELAAVRARESSVPYLETLGLVDQLFANGLLDEEPARHGDLIALGAKP